MRFEYWGMFLVIDFMGVPVWICLPLVVIMTFLFFLWTRGDLGKLRSVLYTLSLFGSMFLHELGHTIVAISLAEGISEAGFGGFYAYVRTIPDVSQLHPLVEILVALAGPLVNLVIGLFLFQRYQDNELLKKIGGTNVALAIYNLAPIPPFDGFHALFGACRIFVPPNIAYVLAIGIGISGYLFRNKIKKKLLD